MFDKPVSRMDVLLAIMFYKLFSSEVFFAYLRGLGWI
jgi:hypothetical protein